MAATIYEQAWSAGRSFEDFLDEAEKNADLWRAVTRRVAVDPAALVTVEAALAEGGPRRLLALADDWCGDAVNALPVVAALAEAAGLPLRVVGREEIPGLMERHLTGTARSIPVVVLLDAELDPRGWWGPRPAELQAWFEREGRALPSAERYKEIRRWYARDRGIAVAREVAELVACGADDAAPRFEGTTPCEDRHAA